MAEPTPSSSGLEAGIEAFFAEADEGSAAHALPRARWTSGPEPGSRIGDFEIVRRVGAGGMGVVFEARQLSVGARRVAVKVFRDALLDGHGARMRFEREVQAVAGLDHPGIVPIVAAGSTETAPFYAMRFVEGLSAAELVESLRACGGVPERSAALRELLEGTWLDDSTEESGWSSTYVDFVTSLIAQVARALQHAHERGMVHRDVKPANVMITAKADAVLLDFGLASFGDDSLTRTGAFVGTLAYASPEQARGEGVDERADVYSLGATLYELLSLARPFRSGRHAELLRSICEDDPAPLERWVPRDLRTVCMKALEKLPHRRYPSAAAFSEDLEAVLAGRPIRGRQPSSIERLSRKLRRHPLVVTAVAAVLLVAAIAWGERRWEAHSIVGEAQAKLAAAARDAQVLVADLHAFGRAEFTVANEARMRLRPALRQRREELHARLEAAAIEFRRALSVAPGYGPAERGLTETYRTLLHEAFGSWDDLIDAPRVERLELALVEVLERESDALLESVGSANLSTVPTGASLVVLRDGQVLERGTSPLELRLPEGSYTAVARYEGHVTTRFPFVVRRNAALEASGGVPAADHEVELLDEADVAEGFLPVPGGWTLMEDVPPRWAYVETFQIARREVTFREWMSWLTGDRISARDADPLSADVKPRLGDSSTSLCIRYDAERGLWETVPGLSSPDWPVRGLKPSEMLSFIEDQRLEGDRFYPSLPRIAELVRAARGADSREYPWGDEFDWTLCGGYPSSPERGREPHPFPVETFSGDVSPFGVRDLAGSIAEATEDSFAGMRGEVAVFAGSYRSRLAEEMAISQVRGELNEPRYDVGFRIVRRRMPAWLLAEPPERSAFADDFERDDSETVGNGWVQFLDHPLGSVADPAGLAGSHLERGKLVASGGLGNDSSTATVSRTVNVGSSYVLHAVLRAEVLDATAPRPVGIELRESWSTSGRLAFAGTSVDGHPQLMWRPAEGRVDADAVREIGELHNIELTVRSGVSELRVWPLAELRPSDPILSAETEPWSPRYLALQGHNFVGMRLEVEQLSIEPLQ